MANILYVGQSIIYNDKDLGDVPAIFLGKNSELKPVIITQKVNKDTKELEDDIQKWNLNNDFDDCDFVRKNNDKSPTKKSVYYGQLCKKVLGDFLIKVPEKDLILAELSIIKKFIKQ